MSQQETERVSLTKSPVQPNDPSLTDCHSRSEQDLCFLLKTTRQGLSSQDVLAKQEAFRPNALPVKRSHSVLQIFVHQFLSPLIYILLVAAGVSLFIGETTDAAFIFAILLLNALLGAFQEWKAEQGAAALPSLLKIYPFVRKNGFDREIPAEELVPEDIYYISESV